MKLERSIALKIARDATISVFIYALPVILMFLYFYFTGQKPWLKKTQATVQASSNKINKTIHQ